MAGTIAERELNRAAGVRFAVATEADEAAIRRLLRDNPMPGAIRLSFEREPEYFRGAGLAGGDDRTIVAYSGGRLVCMGRCTFRECWMDGRATRVGYLAELRLDSSVSGRFDILRGGYRFFESLQREESADFYFTSIAADNERARRLLERGTRGLPVYSFLAELITMIIAVPSRTRTANVCTMVATPERVPEIVRMLNASAQRHQLSTVWTAEKLCELQRHGLPLDRFRIALDGDEVVGCGAVWDQRGFRQTVIRSYSPALAAGRPLLNLASRFLGTPRLPRPGSTLANGFLTPFAFAAARGIMFPDFVESFFPLASTLGVEFLTLALPSGDVRLETLRRRFSTREWRSRLYRVTWPGQASRESEMRPLPWLPDLALL
jgi:hypothetical protein